MTSVFPFVKAVAVSVNAADVAFIVPFTMEVGNAFVPPTSMKEQRGTVLAGNALGNVTVTVQVAPGAPANVRVNCPLPPEPETVPTVLVPQAEGTMLPPVCAVPVIEDDPNQLPVFVIVPPRSFPPASMTVPAFIISVGVPDG